MELQGKTVYFLGDSITEGYGTSDFEGQQRKRFSSLMEDRYGIKAVNFGVCGSRIARQQKRTEVRSDRDFCLRVDDMPEGADAIVVFGGTNDFGHGTAFIGQTSDRTPYTFYGACHTLMKSLIEKFPEAVILILTPLHRLLEDNPRGDGSKTWESRSLKEYVDIIREVAEYYSLPVLDLFASSGMQPKVPVIQKLYIPDGLHPNDRGHEKLAERIARALEQL